MKNSGELLNFLGNLKTEFHVIILTEIGCRNLTVVEKLSSNYRFFHKIPHRNNWGVMGIYVRNSLLNVGFLDEINIVLECDYMKCEVESLLNSCSMVHRWGLFIDTPMVMYHILSPL